MRLIGCPVSRMGHRTLRLLWWCGDIRRQRTLLEIFAELPTGCRKSVPRYLDTSYGGILTVAFDYTSIAGMMLPGAGFLY